MSARSAQNDKPAEPQAPEPVNVVDGIPDRSPRPATWKTILLLAVFAAWIAILIGLTAWGALAG